MNNYDVVGLYDHNAESYEKIKQGLLEKDIVSIIHATGTGKSYNALQLAYDNKDKKIIYIVPSNSIIEHLKEIIEENPNLDYELDFPNLEFRTYQSLVNMSEEELAELDIDLLVLDEFHHIGAPIWGARIDKIVETHENIKILGMTAYTVRDRGTSYERDMVNTETNELFSGSVVSDYDLCDAMIDGVLPKPVYKSGYVYLEQTADALEQRLEKLDHNSKDYKELSPLLKDIKKRLHEAKSVKDIFKTNIKDNGKYIYFCSPGAEEGKNDIETIVLQASEWVKEMGLTEEDYEFYISTSEMGEDGLKNRKAFYKDEDIYGNKTDKKLRIMFAINQYNEGVHAPGLDGVIMGRGTQSDIIFFEQLGRALSVRGETKEKYDELYLKPIEELIELCVKKEMKIRNKDSKEEIIEQLLAPIVIDLANNIGFIKELENNVKDRVKEIEESGLGNKRKICLGDTSFDIDMINEDLFKILEYMYDRLNRTWEDMYELAKAYYEHHGNLEVPQGFKTTNGYEEAENGVNLGTWISNQRQAYKGQGVRKLTEDQIKKLESIGMISDIYDFKWNKNYELAKAYYEHHGNLEVPNVFKTVNGYEEAENGVNLGTWISNQRQAYKRQDHKITEGQIKKLESIGMRFEDFGEVEWNKKYELAKVYYEHHGNLEIPERFKTVNGYEHDEKGIKLGAWINNQRQAYKGQGGGKLTEDQIKKLENIGMRFEDFDEVEWNKKYKLAKAYYEHHGNLKISQRFKTVNGIDYDEKGVALGTWIGNQRKAYKRQDGKITEDQIKKLESIGMCFEDVNEVEWNKNYELAKAYYEHHGNLEVPKKFKTVNGYEKAENGINLGVWVGHQRQAYKGQGGKITEDQIKKLESIGMIFNVHDFEWNKNYELAKKYYEHHGNLKVPDGFKTINGYEKDEKGENLGSWIAHKRIAYKGQGGKITDDQIKKLENIGMKWNIAEKQDLEEITESNKKRKQIEILNRVYSYLNHYDGESLPTKEEQNQGMIDELNKKL